MSDCLFCKIVAGQIPAGITYRDDRVLAFRDINPQAPLHVLVIPLEHIASLAEATETNAALLGHIQLVGAKLAKDAGYGEKGFRVVMNSGPEAGQSVHHVHLHVLAGRPLTWPPG